MKAAPSTIVMALNAGAAAPEWLHLLPAGTFKARDGRGPFLLKDAARVISASVDPAMDLVIDYDHQSDFAAVPKVGGRAPAAGWIKEMQARPDGIWARVEWTDAGAAAVAAKEYRYISPVFTTDKATGEVVAVLRAGLTNNPALPLAQIASSTPTTSDDGANMDEFLNKLRQALGLPETADADQVATTCAALATASAASGTALQTIAASVALTGDAAKDPLRVAEAVKTALGARDQVIAQVAASAGVAVGADLTVVAAAVSGAIGNPDPTKFVPAETVRTLQTQVAALTTGRLVGKVDAAIEAGKIAPAQRDWAMSYAAKDEAGFDAFTAAQPVILSASSPTPKTVPDGGVIGADEKEICARLGISEDDYLKTRKLQQEVG